MGLISFEFNSLSNKISFLLAFIEYESLWSIIYIFLLSEMHFWNFTSFFFCDLDRRYSELIFIYVVLWPYPIVIRVYLYFYIWILYLAVFRETICGTRDGIQVI